MACSCIAAILQRTSTAFSGNHCILYYMQASCLAVPLPVCQQCGYSLKTLSCSQCHSTYLALWHAVKSATATVIKASNPQLARPATRPHVQLQTLACPWASQHGASAMCSAALATPPEQHTASTPTATWQTSQCVGTTQVGKVVVREATSLLDSCMLLQEVFLATALDSNSQAHIHIVHSTAIPKHDFANFCSMHKELYQCH